MHPIMLAADGAAVVETQLLVWLAGGAGTMLILLYGLNLKKLGSLTDAIKELTKEFGEKTEAAKDERHALDRRVIKLEGRIDTAEAEIAALKRDTLTTREFRYAMGDQNKTLDVQTKLLEKHDQRLSDLVEDVIKHDGEIAARPTKSEMSMLAAKQPPLPRSDSDPPRRRTDGTVELAPYGHGPGPMRPKLKSQRDR